MNTDAQNAYFSISSSNTTHSVGFTDTGDGIPMVYNGVNVLYFPKSYVEKGTTTGTLGGYAYPTSGGYAYSSGNVLWFGNGTFLDKRSWDLLKPAKLDQTIIDSLASKTTASTANSYWSVTGQTYKTTFDVRDIENFSDGYIVELSAFQNLATEVTGSPTGVQRAWSPYRIPSAMGTAPDGNLSYVGYTTGGANDRRSDLFYINNSSTAKNGYMQYAWQDCGIFGCSFSDFLGSTLGSILIFAARLNPWFNLGYTATNLALGKGNIGDLALSLIQLNTPTPGGTTPASGTVFSIPQIATATSTIAETIQATGVITDAAKAVEAAKLIMNTGLTYLSNGQDFEKAFASAAGTLIGQQAAQQLASSLNVQSADIKKIMTATTTATTKAVLLNQNVEKAAMSAFVSTSIPLALDGALKEAGLTLSLSAKKAISDAATAAALLPNANVSEVIKSAVAGTLIDGAVSKVTGELISAGVITSTDTAMFDKIKNYIGPLLNGRSVDELMNSSIVADAIKAADLEGKNFVAKDKGWSDWATWQNAKSLFGSTVTPQFYEDRVVSPEKIIKILDQENVPVADRQNIIDFYKGVVGKDATAEQVLADVRKFVNPLYLTQAEEQYLNNVFSKIDGFDSDFYKEEYDLAIKAAKAGNLTAVEEIAAYVDRSFTSTGEAEKLLKEAFAGVGDQNYQPTQAQLDAIKGKTQGVAYTIAQDMAAKTSTIFDGSSYATPREALDAAKKAGFNSAFFSDGMIYKDRTALEEAEIRARIEAAPTYTDAVAMANKELGPGRTFGYNGNTYATKLPDGVFNGLNAASKETAAIMAWGKNQDKFLAPDGKVYQLSDAAKELIRTSPQTYGADFQKELGLALTYSPAQTNQTSVLSTIKGVADQIGAEVAQLFNSSQKGVYESIVNSAKTYALMTGDISFENAATKWAQELVNEAAKKDLLSVPQQRENILNAVRESAKTDSIFEKMSIMGSAIWNNRIGFIDIFGTEFGQDIPTAAAIVGIAAATKNPATTWSAITALSVSSTFLETAGPSGESAYKAAIAQGDSPEVARDKAFKNAFGATLIEMGPGLVADAFLAGSLVKAMGTSFAGLGVGVVSNAALSFVTESASGTGQSLYEQYVLNPNKPLDFSKAVSDGIFEGIIGSSVAAGTYGTAYALMPSTVIGKDYKGEDVTISDILQNTKTLDTSTLRTDIPLVTTENGNALTLGGMFTILPDNNFSAELQKTYLPQIFDNPNMVVGKDALGNNVTYAQIENQVTEGKTYSDVFNDIVNPVFDVKEDRQKSFIVSQYQNLGFTPTEQQIQDLVQENPQGSQSIATNAKKLAFTEIAKQENYTLPDAVLEQMVSPNSTIKTVEDFRAYVDPLAVTAEEAKKYLTDQGYTKPTEEQISQVISAGQERNALLKASEIADPYYFDAQEIRDIAAQEGYTITEEQVQSLIREANEAAASSTFRSEIDPLAVTKAEATEFFKTYGYVPTAQEINEFASSKPETEVLSDIEKYVNPRQITLQELQAAALAENYQLTPEDIARFSGQKEEATTLQGFKAYADPLATLESEAREFLAAQGYANPTQEDVRLVMDQISEIKAQEKAIAVADPNVFDIQEVKDAAAAEGITLTDEQARAIAKEAKEAEAVAAYRTELDPTAVTEAEARDFFNTYGYTPNVQELAQFVKEQREEDIRTQIGEYVAPRQVTRAEAEQFFAELGYVPTEQEIQQYIQSGPTIEQDAIKRQLGEYVDPRFVSEQEVRDIYASLGLTRPTLQDVRALAGQYAESELAGRAESSLQEAKINSIYEQLDALTNYNSLADQQKAIVDQLTQQGIDFTSAVSAVKGELSETIEQRYSQLSDQQKAIADQLVAQGSSLNAAILTAKGEMSAELQTAYSALSDKQKQLADQLTQQGVDLTTAIQTVKTEFTADLQTKYDTLSSQQQNLANQLVQQGVDFNTAINTAKTQFSQDLQTKYETLTTQQRELADGLVRQGVDLTTAINAASGEFKAGQEELKQQIAANEAARVAAEAERARQAQSQKLQQMASGFLGVPLFGALASQAAPFVETPTQWKKPFITSTTKQEEFKGPLAEFQKEVEEGSYLEPSFAEEPSEEARMQEFMGMEENRQEGESMPNYFTYGDQTDIDEIFNPFGPQSTSLNEFEPFMAASGGLVPPLMAGGGSTRYGRYAGGGLPVIEHSGKARLDFRTGAAVTGPGDGQSDDIPAMLADGEFVIPADVVAALGNGSTKAGSDKLYDMMHSVRAHHRAAHPKDLPPPAKSSPLDYLKKSSKGRR